MAGEWRASTWGEEISLEYGKGVRGHETAHGPYRVFGSNGPIGWTTSPLTQGPGVILGRKGAYRGVEYSRDPFFVIDTAYYVVPKSKLDMRWLYYAIRHYKLGEIDDGSPIPSTTRAAVYMLDLDVPPLDEQRAIAHILGTLDDKIELNRRMNETLEAIARALFKAWFVDFEPVRAKAEGRGTGLPEGVAGLFPDRFVESEVGEIPEGWSAKRLGDCVDSLSGGTPPKAIAHFWDGDIPWISPKVMTSIHADEADAFVSEGAVGNGTRFAPKESTLVMVRGMGLHEGVRVSQARNTVTFNQDVKALVGRSINPTLLLFAMLDAQRHLLDRVETSGHGTGKLPTEVLLSIPLVMPLGPTQQLLSEPLSIINDRIAMARAESRTLINLRDTLLPKLISGELRVPDADRFITEAIA